MSVNQRARHIELLIETSTSWGRGLVLGINEFAQTQPGWHLSLYPAGRNEQLRLRKSWRGDGIIARITSEDLLEDIRRAARPAVNVSAYPLGLPVIPQCTVSEKVMGELAAAHLFDCGLSQFAYYGPSDRPGYEDRLGETFVKIIRARGFHCHTAHRETAAQEQRLRKGGGDATLRQWLRLLPRPIGLFTWSDTQGRLIVEACRSIGINVPGEVAVLSGETDDLMARVSVPSLSSIDPGPMNVGYEAAELLHTMLAGQIPESAVRQIPPAGVIARGSTDVSVIDDPLVSQAMEYIRQNVARHFAVDNICDQLGISRRSLETHFQDTLGRSPAAEILRIRIDLAKELIMTTSLPIREVAASCGFNFAETFSRAFKREVGLSPKDYQAIARMKGRQHTSLA